jgi:hypothetical protein
VKVSKALPAVPERASLKRESESGSSALDNAMLTLSIVGEQSSRRSSITSSLSVQDETAEPPEGRGEKTLWWPRKTDSDRESVADRSSDVSSLLIESEPRSSFLDQDITDITPRAVDEERPDRRKK